ncbi:hypothetical protein ACN2WE_41020 (plasmid) [Streptomyces sp. cg28]|uniref:hypothetical protein n=1 Tax=Streptomyces sp. cg28 TaxID=3403457 RepID=UPI003B214E88
MSAYTATRVRHAASSRTTHGRSRPERFFPRNPPVRLPGESEDDLRSDHICRGID